MSNSAPTSALASPVGVSTVAPPKTTRLSKTTNLSDTTQSFTEVLTEEASKVPHQPIAERTSSRKTKSSPPKVDLSMPLPHKGKTRKQRDGTLLPVPLGAPNLVSSTLPTNVPIALNVPAMGSSIAKAPYLGNRPTSPSIDLVVQDHQLVTPRRVKNGMRVDSFLNKAETIKTLGHQSAHVAKSSQEHPVVQDLSVFNKDKEGLQMLAMASSTPESKTPLGSEVIAPKESVAKAGIQTLNGQTFEGRKSQEPPSQSIKLGVASQVDPQAVNVPERSGNGIDSATQPLDKVSSDSNQHKLSRTNSSSSLSSVIQAPAPAAVASTASITSPVAPEVSNSLNVKMLSEAISRPLTDGNGTYTVVVTMHPANLGHLQAVVTLGRGELQVSIVPETLAGHVALTNSVDALKTQLSEGGMNVNVTLSHPESQHKGDPKPHSNMQNRSGPIRESINTVGMPMVTTSQIHLVL